MNAFASIAAIAAAALALALLIAAYYGAFARFSPSVSTEGGEILVYEELRGDYRLSGMAMDKVYYSLADESGISTYRGFGIYYDDPKSCKKEDLRSEAGCVLEAADYARVEELKKLHKVREFPVGEYLSAAFPYKGKLSALIGISRVYPAMAAIAAREGYSPEGFMMEQYDIPNKRILYRKELRRRG